MKKYLLAFGVAVLYFNTGAQTVTWSQDIAPILYANCTKCHNPNGAGHFSLLTFSDAYTWAYNMESATAAHIMPPWPPNETYKHFVHERVLPQADIDKISQWVAGGRPQGDITLAPAQPTYSTGSSLGSVDLTVRIPTYTITANNDVYRNFPITTTVPAGSYITAMEVIPGNTHAVHHVLIFQDSTNVPAQLDANQSGPGYTDAGGTGSLASKLIGGYTPGASPYYTPVGTGFRLAANTNIVVQVHYPAGSQGQVDSTRINFKITSTPQREITVYPLVNHLQNMTNGPINIPANTTKTYYEQYNVSGNYTFLSAFPHMHLVGTTIKSWANKTSAPFDTVRFVDVPDWDFHWQDTYVFPNAVKVPSGYKIQAVATYDNTANNPDNPNTPPQNVTAGEATTDEMMMVFFGFMPYVSGDENLIIDRRVIPQGATTFCNGQSVVLKTIEGNGYTYQWYRNGGLINGATAYSYAATQAGNYHVQIFLGPNNALSDTIAVNVNSTPSATVTPAGSTTICTGTSVTLNASTGSGYTYQWLNNGTPIGSAVSSSYNTAAAGNYTVQIYNGCYAVSQAVTVTTVSSPSGTVTPSGSTTFCQGGSVTLSAAAGLSYHWSNNATTQTINVNQSGTYTLTVTDGNNCSAVSSSTTVTVNSLPSATVTPDGATTFCQGGSVTLSAPAGLTYSWSTGGNTQSITANQTGSYVVTVTNANNCSAVSTSIPVTVNSLPNAGVTAGGALTFCNGGSVSLSAAAGLTYHWSNNAATQSISVTQAGSYTVTVTNANNCSALSSATTVTVNALPNSTVTAGGATTFCQGGSVSLSAPAGLTYNWSNNATTQTISTNQSGSYTVTVTNSNNCTAVSSATIVTVNSLPTVAITPNGPLSFCEGGSVMLNGTASANYHWSNNSTAQSITVLQSGNYTLTITDVNNCSNSAATTVTVYSNPSAAVTTNQPTTICPGDSVTLSGASGLNYNWSNGQTSQNITVTTNGNFTLTVTDNHSCSAISTPITVTISNSAIAGITTSGATTFCEGSSVQLTATSGVAYQWSNNETTSNITVSASGTYTVTVTEAGSCIAVSNPIEIIVHSNPPVPVISASGPLVFCVGGTVDLSAPSGFSYLWSTNETTQSLTVSGAGNYTYTLTVTDANSCTAVSTPVLVTVNALPVVTLNGNADVACSDAQAFTLAGENPAGGNFSGPGVSGNTFDPAIAGTGIQTVTYTYTDNNGCVNSASETIEVSVCSGINEVESYSLTITPNPSNGNFELNWNDHQSGNGQLSIFDVSGKLLYTSLIEKAKTEIALSSIPSGCYLLQLKTGREIVHRKLQIIR